MSANAQHADDIEIPAIEIEDGWVAQDVESIDECNDAFAFLMSAVASIEKQIEEYEAELISRDISWAINARYALKMKKAALQIVATKRGQLQKQEKAAQQDSRDRALLDHIRSVTPDEQFLLWVEKSGCNKDSPND